jgi:hypothetical protein
MLHIAHLKYPFAQWRRKAIADEIGSAQYRNRQTQRLSGRYPVVKKQMHMTAPVFRRAAHSGSAMIRQLKDESKRFNI